MLNELFLPVNIYFFSCKHLNNWVVLAEMPEQVNVKGNHTFRKIKVCMFFCVF